MNKDGGFIGSDSRKKIILLDTTLRDGHQCPGAAIESDDDYFNIVRGLDQIGFDICEVGFPASSKNEFSRVNEVAKMCSSGEISTIVGGLTQMVDFQVDATLKALDPLKGTNKGFFHIYFPVDPKLRKASIGDKISDSQAINNVAKFSKLASSMGFLVQFSPEGYSNVGDNFDFCTDLMIAAGENGCTYFNMPDTIGGQDIYNTTTEYYVDKIKKHINIIGSQIKGNKFIYSVHNHNDLGTAVDNSINAVLDGSGISKIEGTMNGIGERAGNTDLNQIIVRMKTSLKNRFNIDHIDASHIVNVSNLVSNAMLPVQPNYPIVGSNSMKHTSGGHTNAILNNSLVYQPFDPSLVGGSISLVYGPNSGGNLAINIIEKSGYLCDISDKRSLDEFLKLHMKNTGRYKGLTDKELLELYFQYRSPIIIDQYKKEEIVDSKCISVNISGKIFGEKNIIIKGETVFIALKNFISNKLPGYGVLKYNSESESPGAKANANTTIEIQNINTGDIITGTAIENDTEMALLKALANAFNKVYFEKNFSISGQKK